MRITLIAWLLVSAGTLVAQDGFRPRLVAPTPIGPAPNGPVIIEGPTAYDSFIRTPYPVPYGPAMLVPPPIVPAPPARLVAPPVREVAPTTTRRVETIGPESRTVRRVETPTESAPLVISIGEAFANRFVSRSNVEAAPVLDVILDANVEGWQQTRTDVSLDMLESASGARFDIRAVGSTNSDTFGQTNLATVRTIGSHQFNMSKPIYFDGTQFLVQRARGFVNPSSQTVGAWTRYDDIPLIGPIANRTAYRTALERKSTTERITADRIAERLIPRFNTEVNNGMIDLNAKLKEQRTSLTEQGLWPERLAVSSTDTALSMSAWFRDASEDVAPIANPADVGSDEVHVAVHRDVLEAALAELDLGGRVFQPKDLEAPPGNTPGFLKIELPESEEDANAGMADLVRFVIDDEQPITVDFEKGRLLVGVRLGLRPAIGPEIGPFDVEIVTKASATTREIVFEPGEVSVTPVDEKDVSAAAVAKLIGEQTNARMPTIRLPRKSALPGSLSAGGVSSLEVVGLRLDDGWCTIRLR